MAKASLGFATGWLAAMLVSLVSYVAFWPTRVYRFEPDGLIGIALIGALWAAALPLLVVWIASLRRPPPPALAASVCAVVLLLQGLCRSIKPWQHYGTFPVWMLLRDFLQALPTTLTAGLVFGLVVRSLGRDNSYKPTPFWRMP